MREYIICITFWMFFTMLLHMLGRVVTKGKSSEAYALATGYLLYSLLAAIGGLVTQFLALPWTIFAVYLVTLLVVLVGYIIYMQRKQPVGFFQVSIGQYIKDNWVIYVVLGVLTGLLFFYYRGFWLGNCLDDGYYITKVATLPYTNTGYGTNYSVGVANTGFDSYILNTWELEASVYVKLLGIKPTLYLRLFQSVFHYFLFLNVGKAFAENILKKLKINIKPNLIQYPLMVTILFGVYYVFLSETSLFPLRDMFHVATGMFLGSSVSKMMGIILLLLYYIDVKKLTWKMVTGVIAISIVLLSKSTIALPVIMIVAYSYFVTSLFFDYEKREKIFAIIFLGLYGIVAIILPNLPKTESVVYSDVLRMLHSPITIICVIIFLLSFWLKERIVNRINCVMILIAGLMFIPELNDIFETSSIYAFVAGRVFMTWMFTFVLLSAIYLCAIFVKLGVKENIVRINYVSMGIVLTAVCALGFKYSGNAAAPEEPMMETSVKQSLKVILNNRYFIPNSTIFLGEKLEQLSKEVGEQLYVISPEGVQIDETTHAMAVILRTYAPHVISVSASGRFTVNNGSKLEEYDQKVYDQFITSPNGGTSRLLEKEAQEAGVNCIVVQSENYSKWLKDMGYQLYTTTEDGFYYIWYR